QGKALTVVASGFLNPANNSEGPAFGLWVALPTGGDLVALPLVPLSTENFSASQISLYPNPASNELNVALSNPAQNVSGRIIDISGREVSNYRNITEKINVSGLANGMYILDLTIDGKSYQQKFLINKN
ncbi:T9SS type A sorting domain-containing protein, partial [Flavobacterium sp. CYK-4]|uniref:T9SS type A sorting domain-containing protein n=1 Tax=Flavobacterium lotistagni TaxID=2709660 RepID=UPI00140CE8D1